MSSNKKIIVETMKKLYSKKLISARDGNISFKPKNENFFYISAGSVKKNNINEDKIIKVDFKELDSNSYSSNYNKNYKYLPSREIYMHSYLQTYHYFKNKDNFVVHAHPPNIISYIGINKSYELNNIKKTFPEINVGNIGKNVKYYDAGSNELALNSFNSLYQNDIVGLQRHGSLSIGDDIDKILEDIETLEYYIDIELNYKY